MSVHYIEKCRHCDTVISQCRCPSKDKSIRLGECAECTAHPPAKVKCRECGKEIEWTSLYGDWCNDCKPRSLTGGKQ